MPKITSVEPQKKNPKRFNIYLDGVFAFGADEDLVVDFRLVPGKDIDQDLVDKLLQEAEVGKIMERMYVLFNIRQRSEKEIRNYLRQLSFKRRIKDKEEISDLVIDSVIEKLKRKGMINDEEFARAWMEARSKKKGKRAIKAELYQKGIDKEIIEEVMSDEFMVHGEKETASQLLEKKMRIWKNLSEMELKKKAYNFLLRRGFEYEIVRGVVENLTRGIKL